MATDLILSKPLHDVCGHLALVIRETWPTGMHLRSHWQAQWKTGSCAPETLLLCQ